MASKIVKQEGNVVTLNIKVSKDDVSAAYNEASKNVSKNANIPGFRKGKVPAAVLEKHVGEGAIIQETIDMILPSVYAEALRKNDLEAIDKPSVEIVKADKEGPFEFNLTVQVVPEGKIEGYKGIKLDNVIIELDETYVDNELDAMRLKSATIETVDDAAKVGDTVVIDFEGFIGDEAFPGGKGDGFPLELGSNSFIPGFEDQLVEAKAGDDVEVKVTFPEEYHAEELKGKDTLFKVHVHEVKRKKLPEVTDAFVKEISEFDTIEELKNNIREELKDKKQNIAENKLRTDALDMCTEMLEVEVPQIMIDERTSGFIKDIEMDMAQQGLTLEKYYEATGLNEDSIREQYKENAIKHIKRDILLDTVAKLEKIKALKKDVDKEIVAMSKLYNQDKANLEAYFKTGDNEAMLKRGLVREKALQFILENAEVTEVVKKEEK